MKKNILILLLVVLLIPVSVNASKVYTKNYFIEGENPKEYPYKSKEYIIKSNTSEVKPEEKKNRKVEEETSYGYNQMSIRYIVINNFSLTTNTYFSELEIFNKEEKLSFNYTCQNCYGNIITNLTNNIYEKDLDRPIMSSLKIVIDLEKNYKPQELKFITSFSNPNEEKFQSGYDIWLLKEKPEITTEHQKFPSSLVYKRPLNINKEKTKSYYTFENLILEENILTRIYDEEITYFKEKQTTDFHKLKDTKIIYNYQDTLFKYYKEIKSKKKKVIKCSKLITKKKSNNHIFKRIINNNYSPQRKATHLTYETQKPKSNNQQKQVKKTISTKSSKNKIDSNKLSNNLLTKATNIDTKIPIILGIFVVLLLGIVYTLYNLKKEK